MVSIMEDMKDGKTYGSLIHVRKVDFGSLKKYLQQELESGSFYGEVIKKELLPLVECADILGSQFITIVTNPPYMGSGNMDSKLSNYLKKSYADAKSDLFACFMIRITEWMASDGLCSMVTMQSWMFLSSFEKMRKELISTYTLLNLMHMENMVMGIAFGTAVSIWSKHHIWAYKGTYHQIKYKDIEEDKPKECPVQGNRFSQVSVEYFNKIPGSPIAYWFKNFSIFDYPRLGSIIDARIGMVSGNNPRFMRYWSEVAINNIEFGASPLYDPQKCKWYPLQKGGDFRL